MKNFARKQQRFIGRAGTKNQDADWKPPLNEVLAFMQNGSAAQQAVDEILSQSQVPSLTPYAERLLEKFGRKT